MIRTNYINYKQVFDVRKNVSSELNEHWPTTQRRVGGYNIDLIDPNGFNSSHLLVGSEGTLSLFNKIKLKLSEFQKIDTGCLLFLIIFIKLWKYLKKIVKLKPTCVELMDRNLLNLAKDILCTQRESKNISRGTLLLY